MKIVLAGAALALIAGSAMAQSSYGTYQQYPQRYPQQTYPARPDQASPYTDSRYGQSYRAGGSYDRSVGQPANTQPDPNNCGTPDEPKACPPMPRRPLNRYPANRD